ncbi:MAG: threonyl-tRNA synthetase editing domain-containing protein [Planctomycetota bacterium]
MRVLSLFCERFGLETYRKSVAEAPDDERRVALDHALVCLVHGETGDDDRTVTKLVKHAKWQARKFESRCIVLHFFAHLGEDRGDPELCARRLAAAAARLRAADYEAHVMPFGYFCRLDFGVHGESLAKVFKVL